MTDYQAKDIVTFILSKGKRSSLWGDENHVWDHAQSVLSCNYQSISFIRTGSDLPNDLRIKLRGVILVSNEILEIMKLDDLVNQDVTYIASDEPELDFFLVLTHFLKATVKKLVDARSIVEEGVGIPHSASIGPLSYIAHDVILGENVVIGVGCVIRNCKIEDNVVIQDGVKIGGDSLGAVKDKYGNWLDRPSMAGVLIGRNCRIEANTVIQSGFLQHTHIQDNVRIGPNTSIGSGVDVGEGGLIGHSVVIAGSVKIGRNARLWGNCSIREGIQIGNNIVIGMGSVVISDLVLSGVYVGSPAKILVR